MRFARLIAFALAPLLWAAHESAWAPELLRGHEANRSRSEVYGREYVDPRTRERTREALRREFGIGSFHLPPSGESPEQQWGDLRQILNSTKNPPLRLETPEAPTLRGTTRRAFRAFPEQARYDKAEAYTRALDRDNARRSDYIARHVPERLKEVAAKLNGAQLLILSSIRAYRPHALEVIAAENGYVLQKAISHALPRTLRPSSEWGLAQTFLARLNGSEPPKPPLHLHEQSLYLNELSIGLKDGLLLPEALPSENDIRIALLNGIAWVKQESSLKPHRKRSISYVSISEIRDTKHGNTTTAYSLNVVKTNQSSIHVIEAPKHEFLGLEKRPLRRGAKEALGALDPQEDVLVASSDLRVPTQEFFPDRISAKTFEKSERFLPLHEENLDRLRTWRPEPKRTRVFNLLPTESSALSALHLKGGRDAWRRASNQFEETARRKGIEIPKETDRDQLLESLRDKDTDTIVIVGHGDENAIYLQDGSKVTTDDISNLPPPDPTHRPVILLIACKTGKARTQGLNNMAETLLSQGRATAVVAPIQNITASRRLFRFLGSLFEQEGADARRALKDLRPPFQLYVEQNAASRRG